jgi:hypothetical protein
MDNNFFLIAYWSSKKVKTHNELFERGDCVKRITISLIFSTLCSIAMAWGIECIMNMAVITISPFANAGKYPRFIPFCAITGSLALALMIVMLIFNIRFFESIEAGRKRLIATEIVTSCVLTPLFWQLFDYLFEWLHTAF